MSLKDDILEEIKEKKKEIDCIEDSFQQNKRVIEERNYNIEEVRSTLRDIYENKLEIFINALKEEDGDDFEESCYTARMIVDRFCEASEECFCESKEELDKEMNEIEQRYLEDMSYATNQIDNLYSELEEIESKEES